MIFDRRTIREPNLRRQTETGLLVVGHPMNRRSQITVRPGKKPGEFVLEIPAAWELRLRRVLRTQLPPELAIIHGQHLSKTERAARVRARAQAMRSLVCQVLAELVMAEIVGREVAFQTRSFFGSRRGNLREEVQGILRELSRTLDAPGSPKPLPSSSRERP